MSGESKIIARPIVIRWLTILGIVAILLVLIATGVERRGRVLRNALTANARRASRDLVAAMKQYRSEYGFMVEGEPAQIFKTLRGENPRKIVFIDVISSSVNAQGEFIDPWGTPYRFDISKPDAPRVWSCGPNRKDEGGAEGSDDIVSWH